MAILKCNAARDYLKPYGYGTLALPKAGVPPLTLLGKRGDRLTPLGPLATTFRPGMAPLPESTRNRTANLSGSTTSDLKVSIGVDILGTVIGALSGSTLGIKAAYNRAKKVDFEFGDVMETKVNIADLDAYLSAATLAPGVGNYMKENLIDDQVYCIVAGVDARQISVKASGEGGASLGLEIPVLQQLVGGKVAVSSGDTTNSVVTYTSTDTALTFGVQVVRLIYDDSGIYQTMKLVKASDVRVAAAGQHVANEGGSDGDVAIIVPQEEIEL
ncbi:hypothetical protein [Phenylobacterium sp.]|uniref:gasdermin n=1 Tax=Phenylobacterium sp. TaxID=1871053 RepID=UPI003D2A4932